MAASNYLQQKLTDHRFNKATFTPPANLFIALTSVLVTDADTGSTITEITAATGYARKSTAAADWTAASSVGANSNATVQTFATCTGGSAKAIGYALIDASSAGNIQDYGLIKNPAAAVITITALTRVTTTVTAVATAHGYITGQQVVISGADQSGYNGSYSVTRVDANTFTYTVATTPATPATGTPVAQLGEMNVSAGIAPTFGIGAMTNDTNSQV